MQALTGNTKLNSSVSLCFVDCTHMRKDYRHTCEVEWWCNTVTSFNMHAWVKTVSIFVQSNQIICVWLQFKYNVISERKNNTIIECCKWIITAHIILPRFSFLVAPCTVQRRIRQLVFLASFLLPLRHHRQDKMGDATPQTTKLIIIHYIIRFATGVHQPLLKIVLHHLFHLF